MLDDVLVDAIEPLVPEIAPQVYEGTSTEYCTYNYSILPRVFAAGRPHALVYLVQLHYFTPRGQNSARKLLQLQQALFCAGCTYPQVEDASDKDGPHFVLECQYTDCEGLYGKV